MWRRRRFWIWIIIIALAAGGGYYYYATTVAEAQIEAEQEVQTATLRRGSITVSATGAGTVIPAVELTLSFETPGILEEILVKVGDQVSAGDVLARVDDTDAQEALTNAQVQLKQAAMQTDASATQVGLSYDDISVAQAQLNLETAQSALDELLAWEPDPDQITQLEASLNVAQANYNAALGQSTADGNSIALSRISVEQAERAVADAQEAVDTAYDPAREWELGDPRRGPQLEAERTRADDALFKAQENLEIARLNYNATVARISGSGVTSAEANLLNAQLALQQARQGPTDDEIAAAERAVRQAELSLQQVLLNKESHALSLRQSELNVADAEAAIAGTTLIAPMAGTVVVISGNVGETAPSGVIVLADLAQPMLEIFLDETDLNTIGLDYEVDVVFDALPDDVFTGRVVQIDPQLTTSGGVTTVRALVQLDEGSFNKPQTLPVGLNATVEVIGGRAQNALLVPVEALRELSPGQYAVFVMENGEPRLRTVTVGLMDFTFAEILSGLEQGDVVTTGIVETQ